MQVQRFEIENSNSKIQSCICKFEVSNSKRARIFNAKISNVESLGLSIKLRPSPSMSNAKLYYSVNQQQLHLFYELRFFLILRPTNRVNKLKLLQIFIIKKNKRNKIEKKKYENNNFCFLFWSIFFFFFFRRMEIFETKEY